MMEHNRILTRPWLLLAAAVLLIASHAMVSGAVMAGVMILVVMAHLGLLSRLYALFRRRSRQ
jgi:hypothetical protein